MAPVRFWNLQETKLPDEEWFQSQTAPKTAVFGWVLHAAEPYFRELSTWAPIKYLSSDCITI